MVAVDIKGRTILTEEQAKMVALFLSTIRHTPADEHAALLKDWNDVRDVLLALAIAGYAIFPEGMIAGLKKALNEKDTVVNGAYLAHEETRDPETGR